jgi:hypothetical protein
MRPELVDDSVDAELLSDNEDDDGTVCGAEDEAMDVLFGDVLGDRVEIGDEAGVEPEVVGILTDELDDGNGGRLDDAEGVQVMYGSVVSAMAFARTDCCFSYQFGELESHSRNLSPTGVIKADWSSVVEDWLVVLLDVPELLVSVREVVSVGLLDGSLSPGPGLGPPAAGGPPPGGVGGFLSQQRPQDVLLPSPDAQNSGTMQSEPVLQSGPVHIQAIVGLMSPELV